MIGRMKYYFLFCVVFFFFSNTNAQRRILMEKDGGVFKVPCTVNGAKMKFVFDTGAAKVNLSLSMAEYLYDNGYLTKDDIIGSSKSSTASGEIVDNIDIIIRDIEISGLHLKNVHAWISRSLNAPLLLGQSAIQKLGPVTIDGNYLIINNIERELSEIEVNQLRGIVINQYNNKEYGDVIKTISKIDEGYGLEFQDYQALICSYFFLERYSECSETCKRLINDKNIKLNNQDYVIAYRYMTDSYYRSHEYNNAIESAKQGLNNCSNDDHKSKAFLYFFIGSSYDKIGNQEKSILNYLSSLEEQKSFDGITTEDVILGKYNNNDISLLLMLIGKNYMNHGDPSIGADYLAIGANSGDSECLRLCKLYNINFKKVCKSLVNFMQGKK